MLKGIKREQIRRGQVRPLRKMKITFFTPLSDFNCHNFFTRGSNLNYRSSVQLNIYDSTRRDVLPRELAAVHQLRSRREVTAGNLEVWGSVSSNRQIS